MHKKKNNHDCTKYTHMLSQYDLSNCYNLKIKPIMRKFKLIQMYVLQNPFSTQG